MPNVLLTGCLSFLITFLALPAIMRVAREKKLFDIPDSRKLHTRPIASLGGVGIFIGFSVASLLTISAPTFEFQYILAACLVTFFLGLKDDILILSASKKFLVQVSVAAILVHLAGVRIDSMHGFLGIGKLPEVVGILLTYATVIVVINAYNLIDGVDGLAGSLGVLTMAVFGTYFLMANLPVYAGIAFGLGGSLLAFLYFNFAPAKIFMGDSGSLLLGLINAVLVIKFINVADAVDGTLPLDSSVAIGFSILVLPLMDTLRVFAIRISRGRSPFAPDRNHIHHLLLDHGLNHREVTVSCVALNASLVGFAYFGRHLGSTIVLSSMLVIGFSVIALLYYKRRPKTSLVITGAFAESESSITATTKVVALKTDAAIAEQ